MMLPDYPMSIYMCPALYHATSSDSSTGGTWRNLYAFDLEPAEKCNAKTVGQPSSRWDVGGDHTAVIATICKIGQTGGQTWWALWVDQIYCIPVDDDNLKQWSANMFDWSSLKTMTEVRDAKKTAFPLHITVFRSSWSWLVSTGLARLRRATCLMIVSLKRLLWERYVFGFGPCRYNKPPGSHLFQPETSDNLHE